MSGPVVGRVALVSLRDAAAGRVVSVPTARYRVIGSFLRTAPRGVVRAISAQIMGRRRAEAMGKL